MIYNGDGDGTGEVLALSTALNTATLAAIYRLTDIITNGRPEESISAADSILYFAVAIGQVEEDEE